MSTHKPEPHLYLKRIKRHRASSTENSLCVRMAWQGNDRDVLFLRLLFLSANIFPLSVWLTSVLVTDEACRRTLLRRCRIVTVIEQEEPATGAWASIPRMYYQ
jgi:hypothetical protein